MEKKKQSKMKGGVLIGIVLLLISALLVGACAKAPAPATPAPGTPAATPTPTAAVKPIVLKWTIDGMKLPPSAICDAHIWWIEEVKKRTAAIGKPIQFEEYWGGALGTSYEMLTIAAGGVADLVVIPSTFLESFCRWDIPQNGIYFLKKTGEETARMWRVLYDEFPVFRDQWRTNNLEWFYGSCVPPYGFISNTPYKTLGDLKGQKIYSWGSYVPKLLNAVGAVPTSVQAGEVYDALKSGLLGSRFSSDQGALSGRFDEVAKYFTYTDVGTCAAPSLFMNLDKWNSLPDDIKKIILEVSMERDDVMVANNTYYQSLVPAAFEKSGVTTFRFSKEDMDKWRALTGDLTEIWIGEMGKISAGQGAIARKVINRMKELAKAGWETPSTPDNPVGVPAWVYKSPVTGKDVRTTSAIVGRAER